MPRTLSPAVLAELDAPQVRLAYFVEVVFSTEVLWLWSGFGKIVPLGPAWDPASNFPYGQQFTGLGWLGRIESIPQTSELTAENIRLMLSGIVPQLLGDAINAVRLTGRVTVWLAFLDPKNNVIADPLQMWQGQTDVPTIDEGAETSTLSITAENSLLALNLASNRRFTTLDHQLDFPGDAGFDFVTAMQDLYLAFPYGVNKPSSGADATAGITLSPAGPIKISLGGTVNATASAQFASGPYSPNVKNITAVGLWSSSDTTVATVSNGHGADILSGHGNFGTGGGVITSVGPGNCTITFYFGDASASITVSVA